MTMRILLVGGLLLIAVVVFYVGPRKAWKWWSGV